MSTLALQAESRILLLRSHRVMLDFHLAELYQVETRALKQAVNRNLDRFPDDFMFELTKGEVEVLRSQNVTSRSHGAPVTGIWPSPKILGSQFVIPAPDLHLS